jgi:hypothetical protein
VLNRCSTVIADARFISDLDDAKAWDGAKYLRDVEVSGATNVVLRNYGDCFRSVELGVVQAGGVDCCR